MNPVDPLARLQPLRDPAAIGGWPPAPGWWLLATLLLATASVASWWLWHRYRRNAYRRQGLRALQDIRQEWQQSGDSLRCLAHVNALLKALALQAYPRRQVAAASGTQWQQLLNASMDNQRTFSLGALEAPYQPHADATDVAGHLELAAHWIRHHRGQP